MNTDQKTEQEQEKDAGENNSTGKGDGIVGEWKLALEAYDENNNKKLEEEERKKGITNRYYYRFYPDGNCLVNVTTSPTGAFKGQYEIKDEGSNKRLIVYLEGDEKGKPNDNHVIHSVNSDELILLLEGDYVFWVFKRS